MDYFNNENMNFNNNVNQNQNQTQNSKTGDKIQYFLMLVLTGYFGIKIFLGSFNKYPDKFYQKKMVINTNAICNLDVEEEGGNIQEKLAMNYFIPGIVNNEIYDIIITIILSCLVFIITGMNNRKDFGVMSPMDFLFLVGFMLGLNAPLYKNFFESDNNSPFSNYVFLISFLIVIFFMIVISALGAFHNNGFSANKGLSGYILYLIVLFILIIGLIMNKKNIKTYNTTVYTTNSETSCNSVQYGGFQTSGEYVKLSMTFISLMLLFIFVYDPPQNGIKTVYYLINGLIFGIFISGMSFYGFEYFLNKKPEDSCIGSEQCNKKNIEIGQKVISYKDTDSLYILKWLLGIISVVLILVIIYLFHNK